MQGKHDAQLNLSLSRTEQHELAQLAAAHGLRPTTYVHALLRRHLAVAREEGKIGAAVRGWAPTAPRAGQPPKIAS